MTELSDLVEQCLTCIFVLCRCIAGT